ENIDVVGERLRQNSSPQLRIAAPAIVLHDYLPQILQRLRTKFQVFRLYLPEAARSETERLLLAREVDLGIMLIDKISRAGISLAVAVPGFKPHPQLRALPLAHFPPVVVGVAWSHRVSSVAQQLLAELDTEADRQRGNLQKPSRTLANYISQPRP